MSALPKPPSLIASRTQTISSVSFEEAPATPPTRGEPNKAFATPAHRKVPETPLGPTPPKPTEQASSHLDVKTPPRVQAKSVPGRIHFIFDYKQKWLPLKHLESQQDAFGKRGKSIWGAAAFRWDSEAQEFEVLNVRIACNDSNQNWYHSVHQIAATLDIITEAWRDCTSAKSSGASSATTCEVPLLMSVSLCLGLSARTSVSGRVPSARCWARVRMQPLSANKLRNIRKIRLVMPVTKVSILMDLLLKVSMRPDNGGINIG